jgi:hypothetical protein
MFRPWLFLWVACLLLPFHHHPNLLVTAEEEQIKWTPNEDAKNAPLPLSRNQREQLLKLQRTIETSPDPNAVLQQVADANQMSPQDLVNLMDKNINPDMIKAVTIPRLILKAFLSLSVTVSGLRLFARPPPIPPTTTTAMIPSPTDYRWTVIATKDKFVAWMMAGCTTEVGERRLIVW